MLQVKNKTIYNEVIIAIERVQAAVSSDGLNPHIINAKVKKEIQSAKELGSDLINYQFENGLTLLHLAAKHGSLDDINYCIAQGADPTIVDAFGKQPLHYLVNQTNVIAKARALLNTKRVNINLQDEKNNTVLHYAVNTRSQRQYDYIEFLLAQGADPNAQGKHNKTPLHLAVENGDLKAVRILLNNSRTLVDITDDKGNTPLFYAQGQADSQAITEQLLGHNADPNHKNRQQQTPLTLAVEHDDTAHTDMLLSHGARPQPAGLNVSVYLLALPFAHNRQILDKLNKHSYPAYWLGHGLGVGAVSYIYFALLGATSLVALQYAAVFGLCAGLISKHYHDKKYQSYEFFKQHPAALESNNAYCVAATKQGYASGSSAWIAFLTWFNLNCYSHFGEYGFSQVAAVTNDTKVATYVTNLN